MSQIFTGLDSPWNLLFNHFKYVSNDLADVYNLKGGLLRCCNKALWFLFAL